MHLVYKKKLIEIQMGLIFEYKQKLQNIQEVVPI